MSTTMGHLLNWPETSVGQLLGDTEVTGLPQREIRGHSPALPWGRPIPVPVPWPAAAPSRAHPEIPCTTLWWDSPFRTASWCIRGQKPQYFMPLNSG